MHMVTAPVLLRLRLTGAVVTSDKGSPITRVR